MGDARRHGQRARLFRYNRASLVSFVPRIILSAYDMKTLNTFGPICSALALTLAAAFPALAADAAAGNADNGRQKASMCVGCHNIPGYKTAFPSVYSVPKLDGQHAAYIVSALRAYKSGERKHPSMRAVAASLSDQDMADLGAFYAAQPTRSAAAK
jgi:cytochrome c553